MFKKIVAVCFTAMALPAFAASFLTVTPSITSTYLRSDGETYTAFTVTNNSSQPLSDLTINQYDGAIPKSGLTVRNNTCTGTLTSGSSCTFQILMQNQSQSFTLRPQVCVFNGLECARPTSTDSETVNVVDISHNNRVYANDDETNQFMAFNAENLEQSGNSVDVGSTWGGGWTDFDLNKAGSILYAPDFGNDALLAINVSNTNPQLGRDIDLSSIGTEPIGVAVTPNGKHVYVTLKESGKVADVGLTTGTPTLTGINVGTNPQGIAISPDGSKVYVTNTGSNSISVINTADDSVTTHVDDINLNNPTNLAVSNDGSKLYVVNSSANNIKVFNTSNLASGVTATINIGSYITNLAITPDGSKIYVPSAAAGAVYVINTSNNNVTTLTSEDGIVSGPFGVGISPDGSTAYISSSLSNKINTINTSTNTSSTYSANGGYRNMTGNFVG